MTNKNIDQAAGGVKEAAGAFTGDRGLKNEGRAGQAKASLKRAVDRVAETRARLETSRPPRPSAPAARGPRAFSG